MDWDQDEKITFPEFLHAYETWIGFDDDEEEEEDFEGGSFRASTEGGSSIKKLLLTKLLQPTRPELALRWTTRKTPSSLFSGGAFCPQRRLGRPGPERGAEAFPLN
eukprot:1177745-Prorocentrum_minimum.AAC.1